MTVWNRRLEACKSQSASLEHEVFVQSVRPILAVKSVKCEQGHSSGTESTQGSESMRDHKNHLQYHMKHGKYSLVQGGSNMTGTDLCVNKPHCAEAVRP